MFKSRENFKRKQLSGTQFGNRVLIKKEAGSNFPLLFYILSNLFFYFVFALNCAISAQVG